MNKFVKFTLVVTMIAAACTKERREGFVTYRTECDSCVVEWFDHGVWTPDTVVRNLVRDGAEYDTIRGTSAYHIRATEGDLLRLRAMGRDVRLDISGDFGFFTSRGDTAAHIEVRAH